MSISQDFFAALLQKTAIIPLTAEKLDAACTHLDALTKPRGSLGRLEEIAARLACMHHPLEIAPAIVFTFAGDHGVAEEGVSPFPQSVTREMVQNFLHHGAAINAMTRASGMDLAIVDAGCAGGTFASDKVIDMRLGNGTANMTKGPAMTEETCLRGLENGIMLAKRYAAKGYRCFGIGEMGIANTTAASALYSHLLGLTPEQAAGPGTGAGREMVAHKAQVIHRALQINSQRLSRKNPDGTPHALTALACLGGFEIAEMAGLVLGAAHLGTPVLIDGFIASAAYACAVLANPAVADYAFVTHTSAEPAHAAAMERLAARTAHPAWGVPLLSLGMRLGEGTGTAAAYPLLKCAAAIYQEMATFEQAHVSDRTD